MLGMKKQQAQVQGTISAGMRVDGDCHFEGGLQIDGAVHGDVSAAEGVASLLVITASGRVEGRICADHIVVDGAVVGPVVARERIELRSAARVQGDVRYKMLEMQPGAVVAGQLQPQTAAPAAEPIASVEYAGEPAEPTLDPDRPLESG